MKLPTISVIIPAYNAARTITRALQSVLAQSYRAMEVIIVDDGSTDDLHSTLQPLSEHIRLTSQPNRGAAAARNLGVHLAAGDLVAFLDADDYWEPEKLQHHVDLYVQHAGLGLTCSRYYEQYPSEERTASKRRTPPLFTLDQPQQLRERDVFEAATAVWTGTVVVPRKLLGRDPFTSGLEPAEDRHLWIRLLAKAPCCYLHRALATAVLESDSLSRGSIDRDCRAMLQVVHCYSQLLGRRAVQHWEADIYRRWAAGHLAGGQPRRAIAPAMARLQRQPLSAQAWWIGAKSLVMGQIKR